MYDNKRKGVDCDRVNNELNWHVEHVYIFHEMIVRVGDDGLVCVESDVFVEFKEADDDDDDDVIVVNYVIDENVLDECGEVGVKNDEVVIGDEYLGDVEVHVVHEIIYRGDDGDIVVLEDVCDEDVVMVHYDENDDVMVCSGVVVDENVLYECGEVVVKSDDIIGDVEMHIVHEITNRVEDVDLVVLERVVYDDVVVVHHDENDDVMVCSGVVVDENVLHECGEAGVDCDRVNNEKISSIFKTSDHLKHPPENEMSSNTRKGKRNGMMYHKLLLNIFDYNVELLESKKPPVFLGNTV
ncbi:hypothetical protein KSF78_0002882 [Schistosoma japonicum]|nr:hypothetical protein KSF78_0002882 [Schistosoma japonicum]